MKKIGVLTDIHSNLPALEGALAFLRAQGCGEIICCGDIIGIGPWPEETVRRVRELPDFYGVEGNHDGYLSRGLRFPWPDGMEDGEAAHHYWEHGLLSRESRDFLKGLPQTLLLEREGVRIMAVHYPMKGGRYAPFRRSPSAADCREMFKEMPAADVYLYGHDHMPGRAEDGALYLNPGSLGCPHNGRGEARCGVLTLWDGQAAFEEALVPYDLDKVIGKIDSLGYSDYLMIKKIFYGV